MKNKNNKTAFLAVSLVYFILIRFLLYITLNANFIAKINYSYTNNLMWYAVWWLAPISLAFCLATQFKFRLVKHIGLLMLPLFISSNLLIGYYNHVYWGYWFKRPPVFKELKSIENVVFLKGIKKTKNDTFFKLTNETWGQKEFANQDYYYDLFERSLSLIPNTLEYSSTKGIDTLKVKNVFSSIINSSMLILPKYLYYNESGNRFSGKILFFTSYRKKYYHISLKSGEVSNDHYPFYEFLFDDENNLLKKQMFYVDVAGVEGFEYSNVIFLFDFFILLLASIIIMTIKGVRFLVVREKNIDISPLEK